MHLLHTPDDYIAGHEQIREEIRPVVRRQGDRGTEIDLTRCVSVGRIGGRQREHVRGFRLYAERGADLFQLFAVSKHVGASLTIRHNHRSFDDPTGPELDRLDLVGMQNKIIPGHLMVGQALDTGRKEGYRARFQGKRLQQHDQALNKQAFGEGEVGGGSARGIENRRDMRAASGLYAITHGEREAGTYRFAVDDLADARLAIGRVAIVADDWLSVGGDTSSHPLSACEGKAKAAVFCAQVAADLDHILVRGGPERKVGLRDNARQAQKGRKGLSIAVRQGFQKFSIVQGRTGREELLFFLFYLKQRLQRATDTLRPFQAQRRLRERRPDDPEAAQRGRRDAQTREQGRGHVWRTVDGKLLLEIFGQNIDGVVKASRKPALHGVPLNSCIVDSPGHFSIPARPDESGPNGRDAGKHLLQRMSYQLIAPLWK